MFDDTGNRTSETPPAWWWGQYYTPTTSATFYYPPQTVSTPATTLHYYVLSRWGIPKSLPRVILKRVETWPWKQSPSPLPSSGGKWRWNSSFPSRHPSLAATYAKLSSAPVSWKERFINSPQWSQLRRVNYRLLGSPLPGSNRLLRSKPIISSAQGDISDLCDPCFLFCYWRLCDTPVINSTYPTIRFVLET